MVRNTGMLLVPTYSFREVRLAPFHFYVVSKTFVKANVNNGNKDIFIKGFVHKTTSITEIIVQKKLMPMMIRQSSVLKTIIFQIVSFVTKTLTKSAYLNLI